MSEKRCYYEVLGIPRTAVDDEIRKSYRQCALKYHPDRNQNDPASTVKFKEATEAYSVLSDEQKRGVPEGGEKGKTCRTIHPVRKNGVLVV